MQTATELRLYAVLPEAVAPSGSNAGCDMKPAPSVKAYAHFMEAIKSRLFGYTCKKRGTKTDI